MPEQVAMRAKDLLGDPERWDRYDAEYRNALDAIDDSLSNIDRELRRTEELSDRAHLSADKADLEVDRTWVRSKYNATLQRVGSIRPPTPEDVNRHSQLANQVAEQTGTVLAVRGGVGIASRIAEEFARLHA